MTKSTAEAASELLRDNPGSPTLAVTSGELPEPMVMTTDPPAAAAPVDTKVTSDAEADIAALQRSFPEVSRCTARRFLIARDFDRGAASSMLQAHLEWRRATLPIERTPEIEKVLASPRFRVLRTGINPVTNTNFMGGDFLSGTSEQVLLQAYLCFIEDLLEAADECCGPDEWASCTCICSGGWPPMSFCRKLAAVLEPKCARLPPQIAAAPVATSDALSPSFAQLPGASGRDAHLPGAKGRRDARQRRDQLPAAAHARKVCAVLERGAAVQKGRTEGGGAAQGVCRLMRCVGAISSVSNFDQLQFRKLRALPLPLLRPASTQLRAKT